MNPMRYGSIFILALAGLFVGTACFATTLPHKENAVKHKKTPLKIRVMAEYGSSGLWGFSGKGLGGWRHGMLEHRALKLPRELSDRLDAWIRIYEDQNPEDLLDTEAFNAEGMQLARLQKHSWGRIGMSNIRVWVKTVACWRRSSSSDMGFHNFSGK